MNFKRISFWGSIASIIVLVIILYLNAKENNDEKTLTTQGDNVSTVANYNGTVTIVNPEFPIGISKNMSYLEARKILLKNGWQPIVMNTLPNRHPVCWNHTYGDDNCIYFEVRACSDTGRGYCQMWFYSDKGGYLRISTIGVSPTDAKVDFWAREMEGEETVIHSY